MNNFQWLKCQYYFIKGIMDIIYIVFVLNKDFVCKIWWLLYIFANTIVHIFFVFTNVDNSKDSSDYKLYFELNSGFKFVNIIPDKCISLIAVISNHK